MHDSVRYIYQKRLDEKSIQEQSLSLQERYKHIIDSIHKAAREALGERKKKKSNKIWWTEEIEQLVHEKKNLYLKWLTTKEEEDNFLYNRKRKEVQTQLQMRKTEFGTKNAKKSIHT
ncbi:hypothetical protein HHI36_018467 [Cryptolaemus montrouzieri]|uniref:Uncharacterized protein n=1 Tax=Cryptolaemus montrouzieri TaxID=559131 RepID=A0ABD2P094_9CUCU